MANTPEPITREDMYYDYLINGGDIQLLPKPITRREMYLYYLCQSGFGGGGQVTPEIIENAVNNYLDANPIKTSDLENDSGFITEDDIPDIPKELTYDETMKILNEEPTGEGGE